MKLGPNVEQAIFFIGVPRSGTTIIFEVFSRHEKLSWFSNWMDKFPRGAFLAVFSRVFLEKGLVGSKRQYQKNPFFWSFLPHPDEAWNVWSFLCGDKFRKNYLFNVCATEEEKNRTRRYVTKVLQFQRCPIFSAKLTGPPRIKYLRSIFPNSKFVHIIRDGRAVVNSLMRVRFWKEGGGYERPWWDGGLKKQDIDEWVKSGKSSLVLAAIQWRRIIEVAREEKKKLPDTDYHEVLYEDFIEHPDDTVKRILKFANLPESYHIHSYLNKITLKDMNIKYKQDLTPYEINLLNNIMGSTLLQFGYGG